MTSRVYPSWPRSAFFPIWVLLGASCGLAADQPAQIQPNVVHIMVDDMAADAMGFRGKYPFLRTPHLDRLAREGVVFDQFFVTTSLCSPSRASILTGVYAHRTGVPDNAGADPDASLPTYPRLLQRHGYVTAHIGKWHMGEGDHPRPGFSHWFGFDGQGEYFDPVMNRNGERRVYAGYVTDILTDEAVDFIRAHRERPFAINLWHKAAHGPFEPPPRHAVPAHAEFPKPPTWDDDLAGKNPGLRRARLYGAHAATWAASEGKPVPPRIEPRPFAEDATEQYRRHLSTLQAVDDSVGRVLDALQEAGVLDRTLVVFTADNGFYLGEFGLVDKRRAYDPAMRVPMIVRYPPAGQGRSTAALAVNLDFAPTFLDLAGIPVPDTMQGHSLVPLLEGKVETIRDDIFYEYFQEEFAPGIPTMLAVRTPDWKYIHYPYESPEAFSDELYDLRQDPLERNNLARQPAQAEILESLKERLSAMQREANYRPPRYRYQPPAGAGRRP